MAIPVATTRKRGNPNWGRPIPPAPALATEFELRVRQLQLTPDMYLPGHGLQTGDVYGAVCYPAHSRLAGAMQEMLADPEQKIARPRQIYTGHDVREFLPMEKRAPVAATKH